MNASLIKDFQYESYEKTFKLYSPFATGIKLLELLYDFSFVINKITYTCVQTLTKVSSGTEADSRLL